MKTTKSVLKIILFAFLLHVTTSIPAQVNPSPSGYIPSSQEYWDAVPLMTLSPISAAINLPVEVDNSTQIFFPQKDNTSELYFYNQPPTAACQNISSTWYTFAYEINRLRNLRANTQETRYAPNFSYNHLNHGYQGWQGYTSLEKVQKFLMESGAMTDAEFDGPAQLNPEDSWRWPSGYDYYYNVMTNKLQSVHKFNMTVQSGPAALEESLNLMKHYLYDHNEGSSVGGVITIGVLNASEEVHLPSESPHSNDFAIYRYTWHGGHAMAIVGYNDEIKYDWGGAGTLNNVQPDGQFRNDIDNNKDGVIDMRDWEIGGFKVANSYGPDHQNHGFIWVMYCFLPYIENEWNLRNEFYALTPMEANTPEVVLKIKLDSQKRNNLKIGCGYSTLADSPSYTGDPSFYTGYSNDGGPLLIQGKDKDENPILGPIELLLDFNHFYKDTDYGKAFLVIDDSATSISELKSFSLLDYRWNEEFELAYDQQNIQLVAGIQKFGIEYDLIPHESPITSNITFEANMVSRFKPTLTGNSTMTVEDGVRIDMYNSEIIIEPGSTLTLGNNVTIKGKRGVNRITIRGNVQFGINVSFIAEEGAHLFVDFENEWLSTTINSGFFQRTNVDVSCHSLQLVNSTMLNDNETRITVNRGSSFIIDNSLLSNFGNTLWRGIEVWGNTDVAQKPFTNQGIVQVVNGSIIENAECGIRTWKPASLPDGTIGDKPDKDYFGGVVWANEASFINNKTAVEFLPYEYHNYSYFENCTFKTDAALLNGLLPDYFVKLNGVSGIKITGSDFINSYTGYTNINQRGGGIYATDADVLVDSYCTGVTQPCQNFKRSTFTGLYRGIYALGVQRQSLVEIQHSDFSNTVRGIYLSSMDFADVNLNYFQAWNENALLNPQGYSLYLDASTGFTIEENQFINIASSRRGIGLIINESGSDNNQVYNNYFEKLNYATIAQGYNRGGLIGTSSKSGLCYKCNDFVNNDYDIRISPRNTGWPTAQDGIGNYQGKNIPGDHTSPAGNTFTTVANTKDISNACNWIVYYKHSNGPTSLFPTPADLTTVSTVTGTTYTKSVSCPSHLNSSTGHEELKAALEASTIAAEATQASLTAVVDGGNTPELQTEVVTSIPEEGLQLRNQLLTESPFLSDTVIKTSITKEEVLNNAMIRDVLVANPQSAKSDQMISMLDDRNNPMNDEMKNEILAGQILVSQKENLEAQLTSLKQEALYYFSALCRSYAQDTLHTWRSDTIGVLLAGETSLESRYKLAFWHWFKGNQVIATQVLGSIPGAFTLDASGLAQHERYSQLLNTLIQLQTDPEAVLEAGTEIANTLNQLSILSEDKPAAMSRNLLIDAGLLGYDEPIKLDDGLKTMPLYNPSDKNNGSSKLRVYPNPANNFITIAWNYKDHGNLDLTISDANGRTVYTKPLVGQNNETILDISGFENGTYQVSLSSGNKNIATETVVIQK